jgi:hypothetical protein
MAYFSRLVVATACMVVGITGPLVAQGVGAQRQIVLGTTIIEVGVGGASTRGDLGIDFADPLLESQTKSFSKARGFVAVDFETLGPPIGGGNLAFGAKSQIFMTPEIYNVAFPQAGGATVNVTGRNAVNVTPFGGFDIPLIPAGSANLSQPRVLLYGGVTIADQKLIADIENAGNIEQRSTSRTTTSPTFGFEILSTVALVAGNTIALGGLDVGIAGGAQVTFPKNVPGLADLPLIGATLTQHRDPEVSAHLSILITPHIVRPER